MVTINNFFDDRQGFLLSGGCWGVLGGNTQLHRRGGRGYDRSEGRSEVTPIIPSICQYNLTYCSMNIYDRCHTL